MPPRLTPRPLTTNIVWVAKADDWDKPVSMLKIDGEDLEEMAQLA